MRRAGSNSCTTCPTSDGTTIDAEGIPRDVRHVITFEAIAPDVTRLTVRESSFPTAEARDMSSRGLEECLDKLVAIYA